MMAFVSCPATTVLRSCRKAALAGIRLHVEVNVGFYVLVFILYHIDDIFSIKERKVETDLVGLHLNSKIYSIHTVQSTIYSSIG